MKNICLPSFCANLPADAREAAAALNHGCSYQVVDHAVLTRALKNEGKRSHAGEMLTPARFFSDTRVYLAQSHIDAMAELVQTIERIVAMPAWRERVLAYAPEIAQYAPKAAGAFLSYDFHLEEEGPRLIEINTNAGGGLLNARLLEAQIHCAPLQSIVEWRDRHQVEADYVAMFRNEWALARGVLPLQNIAIVDENPAEQFLAPEFELFRQLFETHGMTAKIVAPDDLHFDGKHLKHGDQIIDLVYNRLTDFSLENEASATLRAAYLADAVVLTPHPRVHALYANKRNLVALSNDAWLQAIGVSEDERKLLKTRVPHTARVTPENADEFWKNRRQWFFKPFTGYGSKGTYRGDKLTKRVFAEIAQGGFIAQRLVPPSERRQFVDGVEQQLRIDLRNYVYQGSVQLVSACLYQGQTTNFRTRGGGFAAVLAVSDSVNI